MYDLVIHPVLLDCYYNNSMLFGFCVCQLNLYKHYIFQLQPTAPATASSVTMGRVSAAVSGVTALTAVGITVMNRTAVSRNLMGFYNYILVI